jgi:hypothetical protein
MRVPGQGQLKQILERFNDAALIYLSCIEQAPKNRDHFEIDKVRRVQVRVIEYPGSGSVPVGIVVGKGHD